ncbi:unnamed protein product, partial [Didymodactylos carnosus]
LLSIFGASGPYRHLLWLMLVGALLPVGFWMMSKLFPNIKWLKFVHIPVMLWTVSTSAIVPAGFYPTFILIGFIFYIFIQKWWRDRYAFLFSSAMDCGAEISFFFIFFILLYRNIEFPDWWGTGGLFKDGCPLSNANYYGHFPQ